MSTAPSCSVSTTPLTEIQADWLILPFTEPAGLGTAYEGLNTALQGALSRLIEAGDLTGKAGELIPVRGVTGIATSRLLCLGLGPADSVTPGGLSRNLTASVRQVTTKENQRLAIAVPQTSLPAAEAVRRTAAAGFVGGQGQDLYRTERVRFPLASLQLVSPDSSDLEGLQKAAAEGEILGQSINLARELVNQPAAVIYPETFAQRAEQVARESGLICRILNETHIKEERMGALLAVSAGSNRPPRVVMVEHNLAPAGAPVLTLVGKGVTFDSGGLSLKPTDGMLTMKCDMAGAATVLATLSAIARLKLPIHVRGYMGLVENMTGGSAYKLGDVLHSRKGVTIEVLNTDAEGRLVLADVLDYAVDQGADYLVDLATLTGACVVALGEEVVGAFTNQQDWCDDLLAAAGKAGEDIWQLPMFDHYNELIKGDVGDIKNTGGRWGGAITAAKFLERFVGDKPWVHLDIAGPAFASSSKPHREAGGTGVMVQTLVELARAFPGS